jgi:hypothetical protein
MRIVVATEIDPARSIELVDKALRAFAGRTGVRVTIRCHPLVRAGDVRAAVGERAAAANVEFTDRPMSALLEEADVLLYTQTTVCFEALRHGAPPLFVAAEGGLSLDHLKGAPELRTAVTTAEELQAGGRRRARPLGGGVARMVRSRAAGAGRVPRTSHERGARSVRGRPGARIVMRPREILRALAPPVVVRLIGWFRRANTPPDFHSIYDSFESIAAESAAGFTSPTGVAWAVEKAGRQRAAGDGVVLPPDLLKLGTLLNALTHLGIDVEVVDFGGGVGNSYLDLRPHLTRPGVRWCVVELPPVAAAAERVLAGHAGVRVTTTLGGAFANDARDVLVVMRSALHYHPSPAGRP